ncbi:MAG: methyltransferase domain-containing protein [Geminicoccaceae bacterium]|nr:methyltransferase domain-containing protein [Geminicoccaceae bacterium]
MNAVSCKACGSTDLHNFYEISSIPVHSCLMVDSRDKALAFPRGDLQLGFCRSCGFIQNNLYEPERQNYSPDYEETQAFSPRFMKLVAEICDDQNAKYDLDGKSALEIGCGKGEFLMALCERTGCTGIGIDPGFRPERVPDHLKGRIEFIQDFYGPAYKHLAADYVCCRHTLEHIGPVGTFMHLVRESIGDRLATPVFFELPAMERVLDEQAFWDIYYEHCSYFTLGSLSRLFRRTGFDVRELYRVYDDQYLMLEGYPSKAPTREHLEAEDDLALIAHKVERFEAAIGGRKASLIGDVERWTGEGKKVALWGSGSKAVSYLTTLGLAERISAVVDINPHKWGKFLAGAGNEIVSPAALKDIRPDVVLAMNPIYVAEIGHDLEKLGIRCELGAI